MFVTGAVGDERPDFTKPGPDFLVLGTVGGFLARAVRVGSVAVYRPVGPVAVVRTKGLERSRLQARASRSPYISAIRLA